MIELRSLGSLELTSVDSNTVGSVLAQPRRAALLCYLALALPRGFHRRDTLCAFFWPEDDAERARHALRQAVYFLRRALGAETIVSRGDDELALAPDQLHCDVWAFEAALDQGRPAAALALYRGELLAGFHISAAPGFEHWVDLERARVRRLAVEAAWALAAEREREGDAAGAAEAARYAVTLVPEDETAIRRLMLLLEQLGDRVAAVRAYEAFAWKLEGEYELQPSAETQALVARIRATSEERQLAAPNHRRELPATAGNRNSEAEQVARSWIGPRVRAADPPRESEFQSPGLVTEPTPVSWPSRGPRLASVVAPAMALLLLLGIAGLYLRTQTRDRTLDAPLPSTGEVVSGIAVLPFAVQNSSLTNWREGLADLVSINLSGVAGLRPVNSRTLLARWRERVDGMDVPELATALEVAERAGARYAVVGSLIANGSNLFVSAGVYEVAGRRMLGTARSQGPADSVFTLVDRLTLEILLVLRGKARELPGINLAQVSTASLPGLKSYLEGEVLFRSSQFQGAAEAYAEAVEADSTFALARYRLGLSRRWSWTYMSASLPDPLYTAVGRYADRLPPREAAIFRAILLTAQDLGAAREVLEEEVRRHPDDAETWHQLGEFYHHYGGQALLPAEAADRAFAKAIELDSTFTVPYLHRIYHAISAGDTTEATRLLRAFTQLAPESPILPWYRLVARLAFGDPTVRSAANTALDTLETDDLLRIGFTLSGQPCCSRQSEQVLRKVRERGGERRPEATSELFWVSLAQGKAREALGWVDDPFLPEERKGMMLLVLDELGVAIPTARLDSELTIDTADSADVFRIFYAGFYAASRARWQVLRSLLERLQSHAQRLRVAGDSSEAGFTEAVRQALEGYALWRRGQRDTALVLLERSQRRAVGNWERAIVNLRLRLWLGRLLMETGRPREALSYFGSLTGTSHPVDYERGRIYEQLGQLERAREAYALFLASRQQADPMFQPKVQDARAALQRLAVVTTE
jgi:DNA-binding SARP family transcriptional activator/predicted negative regulator of RcsB-dependent stress response